MTTRRANIMSVQNACELVRYLRQEAGECHPQTTSTATQDATALRVPLELEGAIWSAEVEQIEDRTLQLIVDRVALAGVNIQSDAAIHYQPDNGSRRHVQGRITVAYPLAGHRVRLNFELS